MLSSIAIVDYGMGNQASVVHTLRSLGYRVKVAADPAGLDDAQLLVLPGVGAYPAAMSELHKRGLAAYLKQQARLGRPVLGICLGMQLLAEASYEHGYTAGLGLIPGEFTAFGDNGWHIGWNTIECQVDVPMLACGHGQAFYFNHSLAFSGSPEATIAHAGPPRPCAAIIRNGSAVGIQFHPEKSQAAGRALLESIINGMTHA